MPAPKKINKIREALGLKKAPEESEGKKAAENRAAGDAIAAELMAVDFVHGAYKGKSDNDSKEELQRKTASLINILKNSPTICDKISGMDEILRYSAQAFRHAVADGDYNKAIWAKNALCCGVLYLRDNVPEDHADQKEEVLAARLKYMKNYKTIIQLYEKADAKQKAVSDFDRQIKEKHDQYDPNVTKIKAMKDTEEGVAMMGRIKSKQNEPDSLGDKDRAMLELIRKTASDAHTIYVLNSMRTAAQLDYETSIEAASDFRATLVNKPNVFNHELEALHALVMEDQIKSIAGSFAEAARAIENRRKIDAKLNSVMNGTDAQIIASDAVATMEKILYGEENEDVEAVKEGVRMADRANKAELARRLAAEQARAELEKVQSFEENADLAELFMNNKEILFTKETVQNENVEENEVGNVQYNYNS